MKKRSGTTSQIGISIPKDLKKELKLEAKKRGRSLSNLIVHLIGKGIRSEKSGD